MFMGILNRRDITPSLVDTFMKFAIQRIHSEIRVPAMEKVVQLTADGSSQLAVPGDLLEIISVHTNDPTYHERLIRTDLQNILQWAQVPGSPQFFHRETGTLYMGPYPPQGTAVFVSYFGDSSSLVNDSDTNWLTEVSPMLLVYAALSYACDYFLDDRIQAFENRYTQVRESLQQMALQDEVADAAIRPTFTDGG